MGMYISPRAFISMLMVVLGVAILVHGVTEQKFDPVWRSHDKQVSVNLDSIYDVNSRSPVRTADSSGNMYRVFLPIDRDKDGEIGFEDNELIIRLMNRWNELADADSLGESIIRWEPMCRNPDESSPFVGVHYYTSEPKDDLR